jgi:hypothetical protein
MVGPGGATHDSDKMPNAALRGGIGSAFRSLGAARSASLLESLVPFELSLIGGCSRWYVHPFCFALQLCFVYCDRAGRLFCYLRISARSSCRIALAASTWNPRPGRHRAVVFGPIVDKSTHTTRLSYLAVEKFWIVVETPRNRSKIDRDVFVPVCGHRPGHFWLGIVRFGADLGPKSKNFGQIPKSFRGP